MYHSFTPKRTSTQLQTFPELPAEDRTEDKEGAASSPRTNETLPSEPQATARLSVSLLAAEKWGASTGIEAVLRRKGRKADVTREGSSSSEANIATDAQKSACEFSPTCKSQIRYKEKKSNKKEDVKKSSQQLSTQDDNEKRLGPKVAKLVQLFGGS